MGNYTREQKEGLEFNNDQYIQIDDYCKKLEIEWFASAWDNESLNFLDNFLIANIKNCISHDS